MADPTSATAPSPEPAPAPADYQSNPFNLFGPSWKAIKLEFWQLVLALLAPFLLGLVAAIGFAAHVKALNVLFFLFGIVLVLALIFVYPGIFALLLLSGAKGQKLTFKDAVKPGAKIGITVFAAALLTALAVVGGYILLIIPGIIFSAWFALTPFVIADEGLGVFKAMKRSRELVRGRIWEVLGVMGMVSLLGLIQYIPILGAIVFLVISVVLAPIYAVVYLQLKALKAGGSNPPIAKINYVLVVILPLIMIAGFTVGFSGYKNQIKNIENQSIQNQSRQNLQIPANPQ